MKDHLQRLHPNKMGKDLNSFKKRNMFTNTRAEADNERGITAS